MAAESIAFADCLDAAISLRIEIERLLGRTVPLEMLTDSRQLFDAVCNSTRTKERRLMIDLAAAKESFWRKEITDLGFIRSADNLADPLTKPIAGENLLLSVLRNAKLPDTAVAGGPHVETWLLRHE